jgi:hypothetical protein
MSLARASIILCRPPIGPKKWPGITHVIGCDLYYPTARGWKRPWVLGHESKRILAWAALAEAAEKFVRAPAMQRLMDAVSARPNRRFWLGQRVRR